MTWIQVYANLTTHPKTAKLAEELKLSSAHTSPAVVAAGILVALWTWAIQNAYDGDLSGCSAATIADACRWKKKPQDLLNALIASGYVDKSRHLHDWEEYAVLAIDREDERKAKQRDRVKRYREKKSSECNGDSNVTVTLHETLPSRTCNADVTLPLSSPASFPPDPPSISPYNPPDPTRPDQTGPDQKTGGGAVSSAGAPARESEKPVEAYLERMRLNMDDYNVSEAVKTDIRELTRQIFDRFVERWPTKVDEDEVFLSVTRRSADEEGNAVWIVDNEAKKLLIHAFREASIAGKAGDWRYINGILRRMAERGIQTLDDAEDYEYERMDRAAGCL